PDLKGIPLNAVNQANKLPRIRKSAILIATGCLPPDGNRHPRASSAPSHPVIPTLRIILMNRTKDTLQGGSVVGVGLSNGINALDRW
ncbi:MAG: hypothetical protein KGO80_09575, partial [Bacteroidetes bacterium]|nr:hypothetical protein [Bacteroidota bacterium]